MNKKVVYRKLKCNGVAYYQVIDIVPDDEDLGEIKEQKEVDDDSIFYRYMVFNSIKDEKTIMYKIYKYHDDKNKQNFALLVNPFEIYNIRQMFHYVFKDFDLIPKNDLDTEKVKEILKSNIKYHDAEIDELVNIIKSNLDILDSDLDDDYKIKMKHNIILYGPSGYGKSTIMHLLAKNAGVPTVEIRLSNDLDENARAIVGGLMTDSLGDIKFAEHGIVFIEDDFNTFDSENDVINTLEELLNCNEFSLGDLVFDLSKITFVLEKKTKDDDQGSLFDYAINQSIYDHFERNICIGSLSKKEKKDIILNNPTGNINVYRKLLASQGKELVLEKGFVEHLIDRTRYEIGGIKLLENYIEDMIKSRWSNSIIVLSKKVINSCVEDRSKEEDIFPEEVLNDSKNHTPKIIDKNTNNVKKDNIEFVLNREKIRENYQRMYRSLCMEIKGQDKPLGEILFKVLINNEIQNSNLNIDDKKKRITHILIRGKAGTGKTFIASEIAKMFPDKVFFSADCTEYTKAGYVGKSVDEMLLTLLNRANGDVEKAQRGILFLDEFDKLACNNNERNEIGTGAVQESLLKILEGNSFELKMKMGNFEKSIPFDTSELIIICAGAFEGLDKIIKERIRDAQKVKTIGFQQDESFNNKNVEPKCTIADLEKFGMQRQCLRRIKLHLDLNELTKDDYRDIMLNSKSSSFLIKIEMMKMLGIDIEFDDNFIQKFVDTAFDMGYGVSSIAILTERIFADLELKIIDDDYDKIILTDECIDNPNKIIFKKNNVKSLKLKK